MGGLREDFEDRFRVVTLDQRGTGNSRGEVTEWSTALFAADAAQVLTEICAGSECVYGTSMGGRVAQHLAADDPGLVERLLLACTSLGGRTLVSGAPRCAARSPTPTPTAG